MADPGSAPTAYEELARVIELLPDLVREKRRRDQLSIREAARQTGMSFATVSRYEARQGDLQVDNLLALLRWVGQPSGGGDV